jgi:hypothetical protein
MAKLQLSFACGLYDRTRLSQLVQPHLRLSHFIGISVSPEFSSYWLKPPCSKQSGGNSGGNLKERKMNFETI